MKRRHLRFCITAFMALLATGFHACNKQGAHVSALSLSSPDKTFVIANSTQGLKERINASTGFDVRAITRVSFTKVEGGHFADVTFTLPDGSEKNMLIVQASARLARITGTRVSMNQKSTGAEQALAAKEREFWCDKCADCTAVWDLNTSTISCSKTCCHLHVKEVD